MYGNQLGGMHVTVTAANRRRPSTRAAPRASAYVPDPHGGPGRSLPCISPNAWTGQTDTVVGPFSCKTVAIHFADHAVDFGQYEAYLFRLFPKRDAWYLEVAATFDAPPSDVGM